MRKTCSMNPLKQKTTMKKNSFLWAALSMTAALVMTACSSDDNNMTETPQAPSTSKTIPYTVTVGGDEATTRATVDDDNRTLKFATGDKLYITGTNIQGVLDIQSGVGDASNATFSGDLTYSGEGSPADNLQLTATLVSAQQTVGTQVSVDDAGAVTVNYPTTAYCADVATAVQEYSRLTGTCEYADRAFSLTQQTAFLNFEITVTDGTSGTTLPARFINNGATLATANVTTVSDDGVKAKFVLPVAAGTTLSSATVKLGGKQITETISDATLTGKVYNVKKTMSAFTLADVFNDDAVVTVKVNTYNNYWYGATGTYTSGTYATTGIGSSFSPKSVSMTKDGSNLVVTVTSYYNTYTVTFNTTNNTYVESATSTDPNWRMKDLKSITINDVDITSSLTNATPVETTVTWNFSEMTEENPNLYEGYTYKDVTLSGEGELNFGGGTLSANNLTFTAPTGKHFKKIVINATGMADISDWTTNGDYGNCTSTWTGDESSVSFYGYANGVTSIVFTLE